MAFPGPAFAQSAHVEIVDADTLRVNGEEVRLYGIDAPETAGAKCEAERHLGERASGFVAGALTFGQLALERVDTDRAGRTWARAYIDGADLAQALVGARLARPSDGSRLDWCGTEPPGQEL
jgi:endonuclease YncB( thermonuclease family)